MKWRGSREGEILGENGEERKLSGRSLWEAPGWKYGNFERGSNDSSGHKNDWICKAAGQGIHKLTDEEQQANSFLEIVFVRGLRDFDPEKKLTKQNQ